MNNTSNTNDEIDLRLVYNKIKQPVLGLWNIIINILSIIQKRLVLCICIVLFGVSAGIGLFFLMPPIYSSSLTLTSSLLTNEYCSDEIHDLELMIEDNAPKALARELKIDTNTAKEIKKIKFENYDEKLKNKLKDKDTIVLGLPFKIKAYTSTNTVFDTLQNALVNYLENNPYALKRKEIKKQNIQLMRGKLNNEIHALDSLKNVVAANLLPRGNVSGFVFGQPIDPINIYKEGIALFQNDLDLNAQFILSENIQVINAFSPRDKPYSPKLWKTSTEGGIAGLLLGLIIAFILERKSKRSYKS